MKPVESGLLFVLSSALGLSLKGVWAKLAYASGFSVPDVLFYRAILSLPLVLAGALALRRKTARPDPASPLPTTSAPATWARRHAPLLAVLLGVFFALGMWLDFQAIARTGAGVSRVILFGFPSVVLFLDALLLRKRPTRRQLLGFGIAWLGLCLVAVGAAGVLAGWSSLAPFLFPLGSMVSYGVFVWCSGELEPWIGAGRLTVLSNLATCAVVAAGAAFFTGAGASLPRTEPLAWVGLMVLVSTLVPYYLMNEGIARLGAARTAVISMLGPPLTLVMGWLVLAEQVTSLQLLGAGAVLFGVAFSNRKSPKRTQPSGCSLAYASRLSRLIRTRIVPAR